MIAFIVIACNKTEIQEVSSDGDELNLKRMECPEETVAHTSLANTDCNGQLRDVWINCYGGNMYPECQDATIISEQWVLPTILFGNPTEIAGNLITFDNWPMVSFAEQNEIINILLDIANTNAPECADGQPATVFDLNFCRDILGGINDEIGEGNEEFIEESIEGSNYLLYVTADYACCPR